MPTTMPPDTPADVSLFVEDDQYVFRVGESKSIYVDDRDKPSEASGNNIDGAWHVVAP